MSDFTVREIIPDDDLEVERLIRTCLIEFGANHAGTAWEDPDLGRFSQIYNGNGNKYWVAEKNGEILGGVGIGNADSSRKICELQKMYCLPKARGCGIADKLLKTAMNYASRHYSICFLETLENMAAAQKFYEKNGFIRTYEPIVKTEHFACDVRYIKKLNN